MLETDPVKGIYVHYTQWDDPKWDEWFARKRWNRLAEVLTMAKENNKLKQGNPYNIEPPFLQDLLDKFRATLGGGSEDDQKLADLLERELTLAVKRCLSYKFVNEDCVPVAFELLQAPQEVASPSAHQS